MRRAATFRQLQSEFRQAGAGGLPLRRSSAAKPTAAAAPANDHSGGMKTLTSGFIIANAAFESGIAAWIRRDSMLVAAWDWRIRRRRRGLAL